MTTRERMGIMLIHHPKEGQQSTLDQQLMSTEQSQKTLAISIANNHGYFA
jgi:hypothetical protein